eukprot:g14879.t1
MTFKSAKATRTPPAYSFTKASRSAPVNRFPEHRHPGSLPAAPSVAELFHGGKADVGDPTYNTMSKTLARVDAETLNRDMKRCLGEMKDPPLGHLGRDCPGCWRNRSQQEVAGLAVHPLEPDTGGPRPRGGARYDAAASRQRSLPPCLDQQLWAANQTIQGQRRVRFFTVPTHLGTWMRPNGSKWWTISTTPGPCITSYGKVTWGEAHSHGAWVAWASSCRFRRPLRELMPGTYGITWVLRPRGGRRPEPKVEKKASKRRTQEMQRERSMAGEPSVSTRAPCEGDIPGELSKKVLRGSGCMQPSVSGMRSEGNGMPSPLCNPEPEKMRRGALWADEVGSFGRRQRRGHWHENHRETLTDWSRPTLSLSKIEDCREENEQPASSLRQTRSLPELRSSTRTDELESLFPSAPLNFEEVLSMTKAKVADTTSQDRGAVERLRMETQRFGEAAIQRFRSVATVRAAGIEAHDDYMQVSSDSKEWCELCRSRHSSSCTF